MKKLKMRILTMVLTICMVIGIAPITVFASDAMAKANAAFPGVHFDRAQDITGWSSSASCEWISSSTTNYYTGSHTEQYIYVGGKDTVANLYFDNFGIDLSNYAYFDKTYSPLEIADGATVNIYVKGFASFWGGSYCAGIHKASTEGTLNIYVQDGSRGLFAVGRTGAAGIGGNCLNPYTSFWNSKYPGADASNINICAKKGWTGKLQSSSHSPDASVNFLGSGSGGTQGNINLNVEFPILAKPNNYETDCTAADGKSLNGRFGVIPLGRITHTWEMKYELSNLLIIDNYTGKNIDSSKVSCNDFSPSIDVAGSYTLKKRDDTSTMVPQQLFINGQGQTDITLSNLDYNDKQNLSLNFTSNVSNGFLILDGNNRLKGNRNLPGIDVNSTGPLTISGSGSLNVRGGSESAGIGSSNDSASKSNINITGGTITAIGGNGSAGIGSSRNSASKSNINITGGTVTAIGGSFAAGIGSGDSGSIGGISISGNANITAYSNCAGKGSNGGAGIGSGALGSYGKIEISGNPTIVANGYGAAAGIGGGYKSTGHDITINGGKITTRSFWSGAGIGGGWGEGNPDAGKANGITINGGNINSSSCFGAGIGGANGSDGENITITGGTVDAYTFYGAAIGGGGSASASNITISGGNVFAHQRVDAGQPKVEGLIANGIGGAPGREGKNIVISGGTVTACGYNSLTSRPDLTKYPKPIINASTNYDGTNPVEYYNPDDILSYTYFKVGTAPTPVTPAEDQEQDVYVSEGQPAFFFSMIKGKNPTWLESVDGGKTWNKVGVNYTYRIDETKLEHNNRLYRYEGKMDFFPYMTFSEPTITLHVLQSKKINLTSGEGYTLTPSAGTKLLVYPGGNFPFTFALKNGYGKAPNFAVKANGRELTSIDGEKYVLSNINDDTTITVEGVLFTHIHSITKIDAKAPTCTEVGNSEYFTCTGCNKYFSDNDAQNEIELSSTVIAATGHNYLTQWDFDTENHWHNCDKGDSISDKAMHSGGTATCHSKAICSVCNTEYGELDPNNHDGASEVRNAVAATHTLEGYTGDTYCVSCNTIIKKGTVIPKISHIWQTEWTYDIENHWHICSGCNEISDKTAHIWDNGVVTTQPTYTTDGVKTFTCICGATKIVVIPKLIDTLAPMGEIKISTNSFKEFINNITFGLFFKENQDATITAEDLGIGLDKIYYYISDVALTLEEVKALGADKWTAGDTAKLIADFKGIVYAKITDKSANAFYISSDGIVADATVPVISGIENGKEYCKTATVTITESYIDSVTVDGKKITIDSNNQFELSAKDIAQKIVVTDKAGNESTITVSINAEHKWDDGKVTTEPTTEKNGVKTFTCSVCGETKTESIAKLPVITDGKNNKFTKGSNIDLIFRSDAMLSDFLSISVNGSKVPENGFKKSGDNIVVTLTSAYLETLSVGEYTLEMAFKTGIATTTFTVFEKPIVPSTPETPETGDNGNIPFYIIFLFVFGNALTVFGIAKRRRKASEK